MILTGGHGNKIKRGIYHILIHHLKTNYLKVFQRFQTIRTKYDMTKNLIIFMTSSNAQFEEFFGQKINIFVNKIQQTQEVFCYLLLSAI